MLPINAIIEWTQENSRHKERILWINPEKSRVWVIALGKNPKARMPYWHKPAEIEAALQSGHAKLLELDLDDLHDGDAEEPQDRLGVHPNRLVLPDELIKQEDRKRRDNAWNLIAPLVESSDGLIFNRRERGRMIREIACQTGKSPKVIYNYLVRYWQRGQVKYALLPDYYKCGTPVRNSGQAKRGRKSKRAKLTGVPTGMNVDEHTLSLIMRGVEDFYLKPERPTIRRAYNLTMAAYFYERLEEKNGVIIPVLLPADRRPTYVQFKYWLKKKFGVSQRLKKREGTRNFNARRRALLGNSTDMADGPGAVFQFDATIADIYLVSELDRTRIIGRPVLYFVIDVFSRLICGFSVGLEGPSWAGAMMALENATVDKVTFCNENGIEIPEGQWPSHHLPRVLLVDRGEMLGFNADNLANGLNVQVANAAPYRADWKGIVERNFRLINDRLTHWLPGAVREKRERGGPDYRFDACLTLREFRKLIIRCIVFHNTAHRMEWYPLDEFMIADKVEPYPRNLWEWGIENRSGALRAVDRDTIRLNLLPIKKNGASITRSGIEFQNLRYTCDLAEQEDWFVTARAEGSTRRDVIYDPRNASTIYLVLNDRQKLLACHLISSQRTYKNCEWWDVLDYFALRDVQAEVARTSDEQAIADLDAHVASITGEALRQSEQAVSDLSNTARVGGIKNNRRLEREREGAEKAWLLDDGSNDVNAGKLSDKQTSTKPPMNERDEYVSPPRQLSVIKAAYQKTLEQNNGTQT